MLNYVVSHIAINGTTLFRKVAALSLSPSRGPFHPDQTSPPNRCHPHLKQDFSVGHIKHHLGGRQTKKSVSQIMAEIVFEHEMTKS